MKARYLALVLVGICSLAQAKDLRGEITSMSKTIGQEMKSKDFKALDKTMKAGMTSDFVYMENGQKQTYGQMFQNMKMGLGMITKLDKASSEIVSLKEKGNSATCLMHHTMSGVSTGPDKKTHKLNFSGTSEDAYVKVGGKWKMSKMSWKDQKMMMDGKPMMTPKGSAG